MQWEYCNKCFDGRKGKGESSSCGSWFDQSVALLLITKSGRKPRRGGIETVVKWYEKEILKAVSVRFIKHTQSACARVSVSYYKANYGCCISKGVRH